MTTSPTRKAILTPFNFNQTASSSVSPTNKGMMSFDDFNEPVIRDEVKAISQVVTSDYSEIEKKYLKFGRRISQLPY